MGEEIEVTGLPELAVLNRRDGLQLRKIDVVKNSKIVYSTSPQSRSAHFQFRDGAYDGGDAYYYVRVIQTDKNMAWASPIWVKSKGGS